MSKFIHEMASGGGNFNTYEGDYMLLEDNIVTIADEQSNRLVAVIHLAPGEAVHKIKE